MTPTTADTLIAAARELSATLSAMRFGTPVSHVYNPLDYAWAIHEGYLRRYAAGRKRVVFVGMNPGPFGMAQTGVPFGEIDAVRDWLGLAGPVGKPAVENPKRPVEGFDCARSEVSGRRLWGLFRERFGTPEAFFAGHFVANYCPLAFFDGGRNVTPDKLAAAARASAQAPMPITQSGAIASIMRRRCSSQAASSGCASAAGNLSGVTLRPPSKKASGQ